MADDRPSDKLTCRRLLWLMKIVTHREKDASDLVFLRHWFSERGEEPPAISPVPPR